VIILACDCRRLQEHRVPLIGDSQMEGQGGRNFGAMFCRESKFDATSLINLQNVANRGCLVS
jgi:Leu/Phe-tRNA-protein transferase